MKLNITLSINAGVILEFDTSCVIWLDVLHKDSSNDLEFPSLRQDMVDSIFEYSEKHIPQAIIVTHPHPDHYSEELLTIAKTKFPNCSFILPWQSSLLRPKIFSYKDYSITSIPLPHRYVSEKYQNINHYGIVISLHNKIIFSPADADPLSDEMKTLAEQLHPDIALLPFLWVTLSSCRDILNRMKPKHIILFHLPVPENDPFGFNHVTYSAKNRFYPDAVILNSFMQQICIEI